MTFSLLWLNFENYIKQKSTNIALNNTRSLFFFRTFLPQHQTVNYRQQQTTTLTVVAALKTTTVVTKFKIHWFFPVCALYCLPICQPVQWFRRKCTSIIYPTPVTTLTYKVATKYRFSITLSHRITKLSKKQ